MRERVTVAAALLALALSISAAVASWWNGRQMLELIDAQAYVLELLAQRYQELADACGMAGL